MSNIEKLIDAIEELLAQADDMDTVNSEEKCDRLYEQTEVVRNLL